MNPVPLQFAEKLFDWEKITYPGEDSAEAYRKDLAPGTAEMLLTQDGTSGRLNYVCPCGCGRLRVVPFRKSEKIERHWQWNGNLQKPSLTPSIQIIEACRWHGYLTEGNWLTC